MPTGRLLIFDDDAEVAKIVNLIARSSGLVGRFAADAAEFFRIADEWQPTHIALDLIIPETDVEQVLIEMARRRFTASIIITSGIGERLLDSAKQTAIRYGLNISGVLAKPFSTAELRDLLKAPAPVAVERKEPEAPRPLTTLVQPFKAAFSDLVRALDEEELHLVYQPKIQCSTGALVGLEVLARWSHPQRGELTAGEFIVLFERYSLIDRLTDFVIERALKWYSEFTADRASFSARSRLDLPQQGLSLSINISAGTLLRVNFVQELVQRCSKHRIAPESLIFDLAESNLLGSAAPSIHVLKQMRMSGFRLSIDHFGTGYSSMRRLTQMPVSEIKMDKSFALSAPHSLEAKTLASSIVSLGRDLGLTSVAAGIETLESLEFMRVIGCDLAQGFAIAPPMAGGSVRYWQALRVN